MPLDPVIQALFAQWPQLATRAVWEKTPAEARADFKHFCQFANPNIAPIGKTEDIKMPGPAGPLGLRVYTPVAAGGAALAAIIYLHGGGFVVGDLDCYDGLCRTLANESGCRVISVDYRLAPEHPYPAAVEDCFAAFQWVQANASDLSVDPNRLAVAGDSAGGNLAAVTCLLAAQSKIRPPIAYQLLIYPDTRVGTTPSERAFGSGYFLDTRTIEQYHRYYMPARYDPRDWCLSPIEANDVSGLPSTYIVTAGFDPIRQDGVDYAEKLNKAGVAVMHVDYPTMIHAFFSMQGLIPLASEAIAAAAHAVRDALK